MRVLLENVDSSSSSGPNSFGRQLTPALGRQGIEVVNLNVELTAKRSITGPIDAIVCFIESVISHVNVPLIQRLDGIYYNSDARYGDWWDQNRNIKATYDRARGVVFQSPFSRHLVESFFGEKHEDDVVVIGNGVDIREVNAIQPSSDSTLDVAGEVWVSASSWRPHKRLSENVRYFLEHSRPDDIMVIAGSDTGPGCFEPRVKYVGSLGWRDLIALYKRARHFVHLARHDNCPNVVVDARAAGCHIVCASDSGTPWIAGPDATVIEEDAWDPTPIRLYEPPKLDFARARVNNIESSIDIDVVAQRYVEFIQRYV
jgi:hypothetical protein